MSFWDDPVERVLSIRIAGNTRIPCLLALRDKGYEVGLWWEKIEDRENPWHPYQPDYGARKDGRVFSATSPEELLGLVAMWEMRGDAWQDRSESDTEFVKALDAAAPTVDGDGNETEDDD